MEEKHQEVEDVVECIGEHIPPKRQQYEEYQQFLQLDKYCHQYNEHNTSEDLYFLEIYQEEAMEFEQKIVPFSKLPLRIKNLPHLYVFKIPRPAILTSISPISSTISNVEPVQEISSNVEEEKEEPYRLVLEDEIEETVEGSPCSTSTVPSISPLIINEKNEKIVPVMKQSSSLYDFLANSQKKRLFSSLEQEVNEEESGSEYECSEGEEEEWDEQLYDYSLSQKITLDHFSKYLIEERKMELESELKFLKEDLSTSAHVVKMNLNKQMQQIEEERNIILEKYFDMKKTMKQMKSKILEMNQILQYHKTKVLNKYNTMEDKEDNNTLESDRSYFSMTPKEIINEREYFVAIDKLISNSKSSKTVKNSIIRVLSWIFKIQLYNVITKQRMSFNTVSDAYFFMVGKCKKEKRNFSTLSHYYEFLQDANRNYADLFKQKLVQILYEDCLIATQNKKQSYLSLTTFRNSIATTRKLLSKLHQQYVVKLFNSKLGKVIEYKESFFPSFTIEDKEINFSKTKIITNIQHHSAFTIDELFKIFDKQYKEVTKFVSCYQSMEQLLEGNFSGTLLEVRRFVELIFTLVCAFRKQDCSRCKVSYNSNTNKSEINIQAYRTVFKTGQLKEFDLSFIFSFIKTIEISSLSSLLQDNTNSIESIAIEQIKVNENVSLKSVGFQWIKEWVDFYLKLRDAQVQKLKFSERERYIKRQKNEYIEPGTCKCLFIVCHRDNTNRYKENNLCYQTTYSKDNGTEQEVDDKTRYGCCFGVCHETIQDDLCKMTNVSDTHRLKTSACNLIKNIPHVNAINVQTYLHHNNESTAANFYHDTTYNPSHIHVYTLFNLFVNKFIIPNKFCSNNHYSIPRDTDNNASI